MPAQRISHIELAWAVLPCKVIGAQSLIPAILARVEPLLCVEPEIWLVISDDREVPLMEVRAPQVDVMMQASAAQ